MNEVNKEKISYLTGNQGDFRNENQDFKRINNHEKNIEKFGKDNEKNKIQSVFVKNIFYYFLINTFSFFFYFKNT